MDIPENIKKYLAEKSQTALKDLGGELYGRAVLTSHFQVVKETSDPNEVLIAMRKMEARDGDDLPMVGVADIQRHGDKYLIVQQYATTTPALDSQLWLLERFHQEFTHTPYLSIKETPVGSQTLSYFLAKGLLSTQQRAQLSSLGQSVVALFQRIDKVPGLMVAGGPLYKLDARLDQIGFTPDVELAFFDMRDGSITHEAALERVGKAFPVPITDRAQTVSRVTPEPATPMTQRRMF
jgi:hypothetical protein